ncbi:amid-like NADH oxidoreductase [Grosmannia clavigera kw1407]|uniref:Amid-like NADH oxidoreductase n=1 Tax=Grosmannia clavigera (strain kw1407 / UAMH 11150) TaxID=655863 RepID=F0XS06_GROCL|nr:amid-like NADH oxidoreductase [Grosmannia clavigera kw1407]EFW99617.1 amid-like NADH oxidoreductase [Grosmannia clavigera kw1407]
MPALRNVVVVGGSYVGVATAKELASVVPATHRWEGSRKLTFDYLVAASGTRLAVPGTLPDDDKKSNVKYLQGWQQDIKEANSVAIVGGGAVGVQMATDLKEIYPEKEVILIHSRTKLMPLYHEALSDLIKDRFKELGVKLVAGSRVIVPEGGFPRDGKPTEVKLLDGTSVSADLVIQATGQTANTQFLSTLEPTSDSSLINPVNGFIRVRPTLQFQDPKFPNLFAVGDIADSGAHKAARPGVGQAIVVAKNITSLIGGKEPQEHVVILPAAIHLTLGLTKNVIFRNPDPEAGNTEPSYTLKDDGSRDMGVNGVWARRGVSVSNEADYHL